MPEFDKDELRGIKSFPQLIKYLRDELDWPIEADDFEDSTFDYDPEELGIDPETAAKIQEIKQLRPLTTGQPWGIFFVKFEPKKLPVVVLRRILSKLVIKKRTSAGKSEQAVWNLHDLLFISNYGEGDHRQMTFANFSQDENNADLPTLKVLGWDYEDTELHLDNVHQELKAKLRWPADEKNVQKWRETWASAFVLRNQEVITTSKDLAIRLAALAQRIRERAKRVLELENANGAMRQLYRAFQETLIHDLKEDDFADMYAQTIAYGLLAARMSRPMGITSSNIADMVPNTNPFLRDILGTFITAGGRRGKIDFDELGIQDIVETLNSPDTHMEAVWRDFGNRNPEEDPVIHFYEDFLTEYDKEKKIKRGVFYTPQPVVSYIVRSVHELLQKEFGLDDGLADISTWGEMSKRNQNIKIPEGVSLSEPFVQILDPAVGTATFLVEVIDIIHKTMMERWLKQGHMALEFPQLWNEYVPKHLLPRIYGYELMMAPYAIAHMRLGLKLFETGYRFGSETSRANVFLTNSLESPGEVGPHRKFEQLAPALAHEAKSVNVIKWSKRFTVIIGNPPYSIMSANLTDESRHLIDRYRFVDGVKIEEKSAIVLERTLQDDYVKFFSLGENSLIKSSVGVLGIITNNGFMEAIGLRGLRSSLLDNFNIIRFLDLHGDADKREKTSEGIADNNVFDIGTGVVISLLLRKSTQGGNKGVAFRHDLLGDKETKYKYLNDHISGSIDWVHLHPMPDSYDFRIYDEEVRSEWKVFSSINKIVISGATGIETGKDSILTAFSRSDLRQKILRFADLKIPDEQIRKEFDAEEGCGRKVADSRRKILSDPDFENRFVQFLFAPFDVRWVFYRKDFLNVHSYETARQVIDGTNLCLLAMRQVAFGGEYTHFFVSHLIPNNRAFYSTRGKVYFFPLAIKSKLGEMLSLAELETVWNLNSAIFNCPSISSSEPQKVMNYIYALIWSSTYRTRYDSFLRAEYPRLPINGNEKLFCKLNTLGADLVAIHLLDEKYRYASWNVAGSIRRNPLKVTQTSFFQSKSSEINPGFPKYADQRIYINLSAYFDNVPEAVWNFRVAGYQVLDKWLKDRKGRVLSTEDINHYQNIVVALNETIRLIKEIDEVIDQHGGWPGAFQ